MSKKMIKSQLFIVFAAILWGTTGTAQHFAPDNIGPMSIGAVRMLIGGSALFLFAFLRGTLTGIMKIDKKAVLSAMACMSIYQPLFFYGVLNTGVATGTLVALGSAPIFSGLIDFAVGNKPSKLWLVSTGISVLGCYILFYGKGDFVIDTLGVVCALGAGLAYAVYVIFNQKLLEKNTLSLVNAVVFMGSAILLSPFLLRLNPATLGSLSLEEGSALIFLGVFSTALAYALFAIGLKTVRSSTAVTLTLIEPLTASALGILLIKEPFSMVSISGIVIIFVGLIINCLPQR